MKRLLACAAVLAVVALSPTRAEAALFTLTAGGAAAGGDFITNPACATCGASVTFELTSTTTLEITLTNTSTDNVAGATNIITALGFDTTPNINLTNTTFSFNFDWDASAQGGSLNMEVNNSSNQGVNNGIDGGDTLTILMTFINGQSFNTLDIDAASIHIQQTNNPEGSIKLDCCEEGEGEEGEGEEGEGETPEPASLLLLGSALTAAGFRMRRLRA